MTTATAFTSECVTSASTALRRESELPTLPVDFPHLGSNHVLIYTKNGHAQSKHQDYASSLLYLQLQLPVLVSEQSVHLQRSICDNVIHYRQAKRSPRGICNLQVAQPEVFLDSRIQHQAYLGVISRSLVIRYNMPLPISFGNNSA